MLNPSHGVLVAEARSEIRDLVVRILEETSGFRVRGCRGELGNTLAAIDAFAPDALVYGSCGRADGETYVLRGIREAQPRLPVVLFSPLFVPGTRPVREAMSLGGCTRLPCTAARYAPETLGHLVSDSLAPWIQNVVLKHGLGPRLSEAEKSFLHLEVPSPDDIRFVSDLIKQRTAIALDASQEFLVHVRLAPVAKNRGFRSISELVEELRSSPFGRLHKDVIDAMLASQSAFFREAELFQALRQTVLPDLIRRRAEDRKLNVWDVACSTGQEPYSVAMLMEEFFPALSEWKTRFVASDSSSRALKKAREAHYDDLEVSRGVPIQMLGRHFQRMQDGWVVRSKLREQIEFERIALIDPWPDLPPFDLVIVRDILIYMEEKARANVESRLAEQVSAGGLVILGRSDAALDEEAWEPEKYEGVHAYRRRV